jgi:hypothetical protein
MLRTVGRRGATLILLALVDFAIGYSVYNAYDDGRDSLYLGQRVLLPLEVWGVLWWVVACILLITAFTRRDAVGFAVGIGIKSAWCLAYAIGWIIEDQPRAWISVIIWAGITVWLRIVSAWPEEVSPWNSQSRS